MAGLLFFMAVYLALMRFLVGVSQLDDNTTADRRDLIYFEVHTGLLISAALIGFGLGKWLNGLGVAYATLFVVALASAMALTQVGSFALACEGHNDIVRHWTC